MRSITDRVWDRSRPPPGPFTMNLDCPQALGLAAWFPFGDGTTVTTLPDYVASFQMTSSGSPTLAAGIFGETVANLVQASTQYYTVASAPMAAGPLSLFGRGFPDSSTQTVVSTFGVDFHDFFRIVLVSGKVRANCGTANGAAQANAITTASYSTAGDEQTFGATFAANNDRTVYLNGGNAVQENSTSIVPTGVNTRAYIGLALTTADAPLQPFNGRISEAGFYSIALDAITHERLADPAYRFELYYPLRSRRWISFAPAASFKPAWARQPSQVVGGGVL